MARSRIALEGLPHSEIFGSKPVCGSPKLIAAYHVLHRLLAPRHSPYALSSLTIKIETNTEASSFQLSAPSRIAPTRNRQIRNSRLPALIPYATLRVSASALRLRRDIVLWSEKTTVCRIFSC